MSQLDISIFYSHLFSLLFCLYVFSHVSIIMVINFYYNLKARKLEYGSSCDVKENVNNISILLKIFN